jgi:hypothetical protein
MRVGKTTMDVERDALEDLKKLKADHDLKTTSDVVRMLLDHYHGRGDAPESEENEGEDDGEPLKRRKSLRAGRALFARDPVRARRNVGVLHGFRPLRGGSLGRTLQRGQARTCFFSSIAVLSGREASL